MSGTDYTENTAAVAFAGSAGETHTFAVATIADTVDTSDETFTVSLSLSGDVVGGDGDRYGNGNHPRGEPRLPRHG